MLRAAGVAGLMLALLLLAGLRLLPLSYLSSKPVINAFAITFSDRWPAAENY